MFIHLYNVRTITLSLEPFKVKGHTIYSAPDIRAINRVIADWEGWLQLPQNKRSGKTANFADTTFIQFKLDADQKKKFAGWKEELGDDTHLEVTNFMVAGHKTSVTWDINNECWIVSSTCKDEKSVNVNHCLTSRAQDWYDALLMNVFKARVVMKDTPWSDYATDDNLG